MIDTGGENEYDWYNSAIFNGNNFFIVGYQEYPNGQTFSKRLSNFVIYHS